MARSLDTNKFSRVVPRPFGAANWVTFGRTLAALSLLGLGLALLGGFLSIGATGRWLLVIVATLTLILDGIDGYLARRLGQASAFGARFDMETDTLLMLALALLAWGLGQAGSWVLLSGLMRYIFVACGWIWPVLALPLPPKKRRQTVCVAQMIALILVLAPPVTTLWSTGICLAGLLLLSYSFGIDVVWLLGQDADESEAVV